MNSNDPKGQSGIFIVTTQDSVVGIRLDRIVSFTFNSKTSILLVRYLDNEAPEKFEGPVAEALLRELRYAGRN